MTALSTALPARAGLATLVFRVYLPFALAYFLSYLFRTVNAALSPNLTAELKLDAADLGLLTGTYFVAFALSQVPLGMMMDRFGPRRAHSALVMIGAAGALLFGLGDSIGSLALGRALIGMGMAGGLMAAMKAISLWFPQNKWALINGFHMGFGGLGAMFATKPVEIATELTDWRGVFIGLAAVTAGVATLLFLAVPEKPGTQVKSSLREAAGGVATVFKSATFWRLAPAAVFALGSFLAVQGLWSGPWLRHVAGFDNTTTSSYLLAIAAAMAAGYLTSGVVSGALEKLRITPMMTLYGAHIAFILCQIPFALGWIPNVLLMWIAYGYFGVGCVLTFPLLAQSFPLSLGGRAITCLNMLMFIMAFAMQYGIGLILDLWPAVNGVYPAQAYQTAFAIMLGLDVLSVIWLFMPRRWSR
jgi:MFS family permease